MIRALVACLVVAGVALAEPPNPAVKRLYDEGTTLFRQKRYEEAAACFRGAYAIDARASLLHNEALAWEKLGRLADAWRVVGELAEKTQGRERAAAERWRTQLAEGLARDHGLLQLTFAPADARVRVAGAPYTPGAPRWVPAGALRVEADRPGYLPVVVQLALAPGATVTKHLALRPEARVSQAAAPQPRRGLLTALPVWPSAPVDSPEPSRWGVGLVSSGGALVALGAVLHLGVALPLALRLEDLDASSSDYDDQFDRGANVVEGVMIGAWTSYGLGAGLAVAGAIVWALEPVDGQPSVEVGSRSGQDVHLTLHF